MDQDRPPTPGQRLKSELHTPRNPFKSEDKGKQPLSGKSSVVKSSRSLQDRLSKSSPGRRTITVDGVQSLGVVSARSKRSAFQEHVRTKRIKLCPEIFIFSWDDRTERIQRNTHSKDLGFSSWSLDQPSKHEQVQEVEAEHRGRNSLQEEDLRSRTPVVSPPPPPPLPTASPHYHLREDESGRPLFYNCTGSDYCPSPGVSLSKRGLSTPIRKASPVFSCDARRQELTRDFSLQTPGLHDRPGTSRDHFSRVYSSSREHASSSREHAPAAPDSSSLFMEKILAEFRKRDNQMENLQAQLLSLKKDDTPAATPKTFSEIFREEPLDKKSLLDSLKQNFVNITEVVRAGVFQHLAYDFYASPTGFWAIPPPAGYESMTLRPNSIGTFPELEAPTISAHWKPKAAADTHSYVPEERKEYRVPKDPLQKPAIPGRCVDPDMDKFLDGPALAVPDSSFNKGNNNLRRIKLNDKVFSKPSINWDTSWALPSFELKARLAARDGLQSTSMISDLSDRLCSLLSSLDGPFVWGPSGLICNEDGSYASSEGDIPLLESLSKLDLAEELRIAYKQLQLVLFQQDHQAHILRAAETEAKLGMRSLVLATDTSQNTALKDRLLKSRLSSVGLFGPAPENDESECQQNYWKKLVLKPKVFSPVPSWAGGSKTAGASKPPRRGSANRGKAGSRRAQQGPYRYQVANSKASQPRAAAPKYPQRRGARAIQPHASTSARGKTPTQGDKGKRGAPQNNNNSKKKKK